MLVHVCVKDKEFIFIIISFSPSKSKFDPKQFYYSETQNLLTLVYKSISSAFYSIAPSRQHVHLIGITQPLEDLFKNPIGYHDASRQRDFCVFRLQSCKNVNQASTEHS